MFGRLKRHFFCFLLLISKIIGMRWIVIGLIAHTCIEGTVRYTAELGYDVTVVKDATADYSDEMMHAALDINMPNYASAVVTTREVVDSISSLIVLSPPTIRS
jgi:isochorismate hydrolase